jgi:GcrA cell cycle regulator
MIWTDERVELLKKLWAEGLSASQIARELGGVTRNAVIGKVHRLQLSGRAKPASSAPRVRRPRAARPARPAAAPAVHGNLALKTAPLPAPRRLVSMDVVVPIPLKASILNLTDKTCRWPIGDPGEEDFCFCGHAPREGAPYCEYHANVAYQQPVDRRRERRVA